VQSSWSERAVFVAIASLRAGSDGVRSAATRTPLLCACRPRKWFPGGAALGTALPSRYMTTGFSVRVTSEMIEESKKQNAAVEALLAAMPAVHTVDVETTRRERESGSSWAGPIVRSDRALTRSIPGPNGPVPLRVMMPERVDGVYLHLHGGGWALGGADQQDLLLTTLADTAHAAVVSIDYRLAPEHPFPAGPDDCEAVAHWVVEHAEEEFGSSRLMIGGESAGAHLSLLTLLRLRDRHGISGAFRGANLVFGVYDLAMTPGARSWGERNLVISTPIMAWFADMFLPGMTAEERRSPEVSPLYADLHNMPPALFTVGTLDPLLDDSLFMAARWQAADNESTLRVYPESVHGYIRFPTGIAMLAVQSIVDFACTTLGTGRAAGT
jgi:acetyl esterase